MEIYKLQQRICEHYAGSKSAIIDMHTYMEGLVGVHDAYQPNEKIKEEFTLCYLPELWRPSQLCMRFFHGPTAQSNKGFHMIEGIGRSPAPNSFEELWNFASELIEKNN